MSSINTSLNYLLASNFSEIGKVATQVARPTNDLAAQLSRGLGKLEPGSKVSARFDYTVDAAGKLKAAGVSVKAGIDEIEDAVERDAQEKRNYQFAEERKRSFSDLLRPRALLSPSAESQLFAKQVLNDTLEQPDITASEEDGTPVEVELFTPQGQSVSTKVVDLTSRLQRAASDLYARNNFVVYNVDPEVAFAA